MLPALVIVAAAFAALFLVRLTAARRGLLLRNWPLIVFAGAAIWTFARGDFWAALLLVLLTAWLWDRPTPQARPAPAPPGGDAADREARALLGIGAGAGAAEIRAAYRERMRRAHPDHGGSHGEAAKLTAARDRLLKRPRG